MNEALQTIQQKIYFIRGHKVMLDNDLAFLYEIETKLLKRAVNRNKERFPEDFLFQLTKEESESLRRQFGALKRGQHPKYLPYAFTEQGVAMLSGILKSKKAIAVNIEIMRAFVQLREIISFNKELAAKFDELSKRVDKHDEIIDSILEAIRGLIAPPEPEQKRIGFDVD